MAAYQIYIDETNVLGKSIVALLKSATEVITFKNPIKQSIPKKDFLYQSIDSSFKDVREMLDGKQPKKNLKTVLDEL
ncbi:hypothetical protein FACS189452_10540 [Bacteroidia bacterium]|nr:hypothetical protein FACS189452_10540 [Bacteroidia bacterium]GHT80214.1 hypothetical protein FACS189467_1830 [Bacteroidia bacterium]